MNRCRESLRLPINEESQAIQGPPLSVVAYRKVAARNDLRLPARLLGRPPPQMKRALVSSCKHRIGAPSKAPAPEPQRVASNLPKPDIIQPDATLRQRPPSFDGVQRSQAQAGWLSA